MKLAAFFTLLLPSIASAACLEPEGNAPFTLLEGSIPTTVYRSADGTTVLRTRWDENDISTAEMYRGLFMLAAADGQGGNYVFEYGVPLDPVFVFNAGDRFEIPTALLYNDEVFSSTWVYEIVGHDTVTIGECAYDTVRIDRTEAFEDGVGPTTTLYYAPALGVVIQREVDHDDDADTARQTTTTDRVTVDPAAVVPR